MVFADIFMILIFILVAAFIIRVAYRKWRRAGVVGTMLEIEQTQLDAEAVRRFKKGHPNPGADRKDIQKFTKGQ